MVDIGLRISLECSRVSACQATPFTRLDMPLFMSVNLHQTVGILAAVGTTENVTVLFNVQCCSHADHEKKRTAIHIAWKLDHLHDVTDYVQNGYVTV
jgi:hypothetical protein